MEYDFHNLLNLFFMYSDRISKIKLGHGLFQIIKEEEKVKVTPFCNRNS